MGYEGRQAVVNDCIIRGKWKLCDPPIASWHDRVPDPALADAIPHRPGHNAHRILLQGESQRKILAQRARSFT